MEEAEGIEKSTRQQSKCQMWHEERKWRITASRFGDIVKATKRRKMDLLCKSIYAPKNLTNKAVLHGRKYEKTAIKKFEEEKKVCVKKCGLMVDVNHGFMAATPDGITDKYIIEVKCPYKGRNEQITKSLKYFPYLDIDEDGNLSVRKSHNYYFQIQGQLMISKQDKCVFIVYTFVDFVTIDVPYDSNFCDNELKPALSRFYSKFYRPYVARMLENKSNNN